MKKQTGITLIALIITIIVMLILVGVTINVALNGGLFEKANSASKQTQKEVDKEMLLSAVVATVDSQGNYHLDQVQEYLPEGEFIYNSTTKVYRSKNGNEFTINETTGKIEEYEGQTTGGDDTPTPEPVTEINYDTAYDIYFKDYDDDFDWESIPLAQTSFYPANLTIQQASQTRKL